jgi:hypothetical protein
METHLLTKSRTESPAQHNKGARDSKPGQLGAENAKPDTGYQEDQSGWDCPAQSVGRGVLHDKETGLFEDGFNLVHNDTALASPIILPPYSATVA